MEKYDFSEVLELMQETYDSKNADYGNSFDKSIDEFGLTAALVRMTDKMNRLKTLSKQQAKVKSESIADTALDLANYSAMLYLYIKNHEDED